MLLFLYIGASIGTFFEIVLGCSLALFILYVFIWKRWF